jgi:general secretion pathway protein K
MVKGRLQEAGKEKSIWRNERGMALLIAIMTIALLVAVTIEFHKTTWNKFLIANNYRVGNQLKSIADSGINIAVAVLGEDGVENQHDSLLDRWATIGNREFTGLFPTGTLKIEVADLSGRLPINNLVIEKKAGGEQVGTEATTRELRNILQRMLLAGAFPVKGETEARSIIDAIVDWIDEDTVESEYGAESSYYKSLKKPYDCRNKPIQYIEELLLVKGITPELLFGSPGARGLADYLTVYSKDGKINLNTAASFLIKNFDALITDELVEKFDEYRKDKDNQENLSQPGWYRNINGWPGDVVLNDTLLTTTSTFFMIIATGVFDSLSRRLVVDAERVNTNEVNLLGKKME